MKTKILFLDTLSTGMNVRRCGIYTLGGIFCEDDAAVTEENGRFLLHVQPFKEALVVENCLWAGGIDRSDLLGYPSEEEVCEDLMEMISRRIDPRNPHDKLFIAGYNSAALDAPLLRSLFDRASKTPFRDCFHVQSIDLASVCAFALGAERFRMPDFQMRTVAARLGVMPASANKFDCLDNAETCLRMYAALKNRLMTGIGRLGEPLEEVYMNFDAPFEGGQTQEEEE